MEEELEPDSRHRPAAEQGRRTTVGRELLGNVRHSVTTYPKKAAGTVVDVWRHSAVDANDEAILSERDRAPRTERVGIVSEDEVRDTETRSVRARDRRIGVPIAGFEDRVAPDDLRVGETSRARQRASKRIVEGGERAALGIPRMRVKPSAYARAERTRTKPSATRVDSGCDEPAIEALRRELLVEPARRAGLLVARIGEELGLVVSEQHDDQAAAPRCACLERTEGVDHFHGLGPLVDQVPRNDEHGVTRCPLGSVW